MMDYAVVMIILLAITFFGLIRKSAFISFIVLCLDIYFVAKFLLYGLIEYSMILLGFSVLALTGILVWWLDNV